MLSELLEEYKESDEATKKEYLAEFKKQLWGSNFKFSSYKKYFKYKVNEKSLNNDRELINIFKKYESVSYKFCKSYYKNSKMKAIDYIRVHINNMYGYLVSENVYLNTEYYKLLSRPKDLYFSTVKKIKSGKPVDYVSIKTEIDESIKKAEELRKQSVEKKLSLTLREYKKLINGYIDRIFENYLTPEEYEDVNGWEMLVEHDGWTEDHYVVKYFCKSLTGYMMNYVKSLQPKEEIQKKCVNCNKDIENTVNNKRYCTECAKSIDREKAKIRMRNKRLKCSKQKFIYQYG